MKIYIARISSEAGLKINTNESKYMCIFMYIMYIRHSEKICRGKKKQSHVT